MEEKPKDLMGFLDSGYNPLSYGMLGRVEKFEDKTRLDRMMLTYTESEEENPSGFGNFDDDPALPYYASRDMQNEPLLHAVSEAQDYAKLSGEEPAVVLLHPDTIMGLELDLMSLIPADEIGESDWSVMKMSGLTVQPVTFVRPGRFVLLDAEHYERLRSVAETVF